MSKYYKIQYHNKDEHTSNWYDYSADRQFDTMTDAFETLIVLLQQKFVVFLHTDIDQFRIVLVNEEEMYTTWKL